MSKIPYNHKAIEKKWREKWAENSVNPRVDDNGNKKQKYYCLDMFPYPSGNGLHVGHWRGYVILTYGAVINFSRDIILYIRWDGMHSVCLLKTMRSRWEYIRRNQRRKMWRILNVRSMRSQRFMIGTWKSTRQIRTFINGRSGFS